MHELQEREFTPELHKLLDEVSTEFLTVLANKGVGPDNDGIMCVAAAMAQMVKNVELANPALDFVQVVTAINTNAAVLYHSMQINADSRRVTVKRGAIR